jgi:hypothetical protein
MSSSQASIHAMQSALMRLLDIQQFLTEKEKDRLGELCDEVVQLLFKTNDRYQKRLKGDHA